MKNLSAFEQTLPKPGGNWIRRGQNIIVMPAGETTGGTEEVEDSVGSISAVDYTKWAQRSLNRLYGARLPTDGSDSGKAYRAALRRFNLEYSGRDYANIDEQTQNDLIYANEGNESYVKWIIGRLNNVGLGPLPVGPTYTAQIRMAIEAFQAKVGLKVDGYVGSKTELAFIKATGVVPPGDPKKDPPPAAAKIKAIAIWFNAFIPNDLVSPWRRVPPFGPYAGKVFLWNPANQNFYATDQRLWSKNPKASARMHSRVDLMLTDESFSAIRRKKMGRTIGVDRFGTVTCKKTASTDEMTVGEVRQTTPNQFRFRLTGKGKNPCPALPTPDIDYDLTVDIALTSGRKTARVNVKGAIDEFPSFEMYVAVNDDFERVVTLFRRPASHDPSDLAGPAARAIDVTQEIKPR
jgi:peptidoglycan hydrolase-like protein with peptidoglycan-binding domain